MVDNKNNERRKTEDIVIEKPTVSFCDRVSVFLAGFQFSDIFSTKNHSDDFNDTRAYFILGRLKLMAYAFAILVPLSFVVDVIVLEKAQIESMFYLIFVLI